MRILSLKPPVPSFSFCRPGLPDVFARPGLIEPGNDSIDRSVACVAVRERATAELLSAQFHRSSLDGIGAIHILPVQLGAGIRHRTGGLPDEASPRSVLTCTCEPIADTATATLCVLNPYVRVLSDKETGFRRATLFRAVRQEPTRVRCTTIGVLT